jgi:hypothetical protein
MQHRIRFDDLGDPPADAARLNPEEAVGGTAMEHDYSLAHLTVLSLTPPNVIDVAARAGYRYASLRITQVARSDPLYDLARNRMLMKETKAAKAVINHPISSN